MIRRLTLLPVLAALAALSACETVPPLPAGTVLLKDLPGDEVKIEWGIPDEITAAADRAETWTYRNRWIGHHGNYYNSHQVGSDNREYVDKGVKHWVHTEYYEPEFVPLSETDEYCDVVFHMAADGRVQSVDFSGNCSDYQKKAQAQHRAVFMPAPVKS